MGHFNRIIVSSDYSKFLDYWKIVATSWKKFFPEIKISIAFVTDKSEDHPIIINMREFGEVVLFPVIKNIPTPNQAKMARHVLAGQYGNEICMIEDIDTIPLQRKFVEEIVSNKVPNKLLCVGHNVYERTDHKGKFPISNLTGESYLFKQIFNPKELPYEDLVKSWRNLTVYDHKESINNDPNTFSDESLLRVLINRWDDTDNKTTQTPRNVDIRVDWIDRSWWSINEEKLHSHGYITCNFLRPFRDNYKSIEPIVKFIFNSYITSEEVFI